MNDHQVTLTGTPEIFLHDEFGNLKDYRKDDNLVVTVGREWIVARMAGTPAIMSHMGIGTSTVAPIAGHTALQTPIGTRAALDEAANVSGATISYKSTFAPGNGTGAITEAGIFNASTAGTMLSRVTFNVVNKAAGDTMTIIWNITIN